ncbi:acyltransferase family protein [Ferrovum sp. PN-J185]|uniref:acyltransferase family protein n=1 Tax=Ferrovum sp. PN-J185 TaxID=1356306 RepID=UPI00079C871F|nr:acyltransferase family protein [Ferrovum sp. PN-J185]KXW55459.1 O-acetyltransferase OatA [Ferrovum sp. PN-J185]
MKYRKEIDGLRALAIIPVILFHAGFTTFSGGFVGVDIFFVISGYLITTIIADEMDRGSFSLLNFYERRARRILPALFFVILCTLPFAWFWMLPNELKQYSKSLLAVPLFVSNILFWQTSGYFDTSSELKPLLHTWSLAVEEQYYLLFPLFLITTWKLGKRWIFTFLLITAIISLAIAEYGSIKFASFTFYMLPTRAFEILIGALISFKFQSESILNIKKENYKLFDFIGLILILFSIFSFNNQTPSPSLYSLIPTIGAGLIIAFSSAETLTGKILSNKLLVGIGLISYSTYLWHQPLLAFARIRNIYPLNTTTLIVIIILSLLLGFFNYKFIENTFRDKRKVNLRIFLTSAILMSCLFFSVRIVGHYTDYFPTRFNIEIQNLTENNPSSGNAINCREERNHKDGTTCVIGDLSIVPSIALIGDSFIGKITKRLDEVLKKRKVSAVVFTKSGCIPLTDIKVKYPDNTTHNCDIDVKNSYNTIIRTNNLRKVVIISEWPYYADGFKGANISGNRLLLTDSSSNESNLLENKEVTTRGLIRLKKLMNGNNKLLFIVNTTPEYLLSPQSLIAKNILFNRQTTVVHPLLGDYNLRNQSINQIFSNAKVSEWATIINPFSSYCVSSTNCRISDADFHSFYEDDGTHLSYFGSIPLVNLLENKLLN